MGKTLAGNPQKLLNAAVAGNLQREAIHNVVEMTGENAHTCLSPQVTLSYIITRNLRLYKILFCEWIYISHLCPVNDDSIHINNETNIWIVKLHYINFFLEMFVEFILHETSRAAKRLQKSSNWNPVWQKSRWTSKTNNRNLKCVLNNKDLW